MGSVSFVVTVYNKAPFLPLVARSLRAHSGLDRAEDIFVNDGSTDDSLKVLRGLTADRPGARVITRDNAGPIHTLALIRAALPVRLMAQTEETPA